MTTEPNRREGKMYVRFGTLPKGPSRNWAGWAEQRDLAGVSVIPALQLSTGHILVRARYISDVEQVESLVQRPAYLVTGNEVGEGPDGEPLLDRKSVVVIRPLRADEIVIELGLRWLARVEGGKLKEVEDDKLLFAYEDAIF